MSFKMGQYGLACDNIVSATMVLASGEVVTVDDKHHPDLLWGIKGGSFIFIRSWQELTLNNANFAGGSNFGVIAELGMRLHEARPDVCLMRKAYLSPPPKARDS